MNNKEYTAYLLKKHGNRQYRFARSLTGDANTADDLCQEVWCKVLACKSESRPDVEGELRWLLCVTKNAWISGDRKKQARIDEAVGDGFEGNPKPSNEASPDANAEKIELIAAMISCTNNLPTDYREVLVLKYFHFLSHKEISEKSGIAVGTVDSRVSRGKALIAECMKGKGRK